MAIVLGFVAVFHIIYVFTNTRSQLSILLKSFAKAAALILIVCSHRLIYTFQFIHDFPRYLTDSVNSPLLILKGLFLPNEGSNFFQGVLFQNQVYGPWEYAASVGIFTGLFIGILICIGVAAVIKSILLKKELRVTYCHLRIVIFLAVTLFFICISLGDFDKLSPYNFISNLPPMSGMRVPSRWLFFASFTIFVVIGLSIKYVNRPMLNRVFKFLIILAFLEAIIFNIGQDRQLFYREPDTTQKGYFTQQTDYVPTGYYAYEKSSGLHRDGRTFAYEATLNNIGVLRGYEPLYDTLSDTQGRCVDPGQECSLVASNNAELKYWSPNEFIIERTGSNAVVLNVVPSSYISVNGYRILADSKLLNSGQLIVLDESKSLHVRIHPRTVGEMVYNKIRKRDF